MSDVSIEHSFITSSCVSVRGGRQHYRIPHHQQQLRQPFPPPPSTMTLWPTNQSDHRQERDVKMERESACRHGSAGDSESRSVDEMIYNDIADLICYTDIDVVDDVISKGRFDDQPTDNVFRDVTSTTINASLNPSPPPAVTIPRLDSHLRPPVVDPIAVVASNAIANVTPPQRPVAETPCDRLPTVSVGNTCSVDGSSSSPTDVGKASHHLSPGVPLEPCAECGRPITERYYLVVVGRTWHVGCLRCSACRHQLDSHRTCFVRDGNIFCRDDYRRLYAVEHMQRSTTSPSSPKQLCRPSSTLPPSLCSHCRGPLSPGALVMRVGQFVYHVNCFACSVCGRRLQTGQQYALTTTMTATGETGCSIDVVPLIYCRDDYELMLLGDLHTTSGSCGEGVKERALPVTAGSLPSPSMAPIEKSSEECGPSCSQVVISSSTATTTPTPTPTTKGRQRKRRSAAGGCSAETAMSATVTMTTAEAEAENVFNMRVDKHAGDCTKEATITAFDDGGCGYHQRPNHHHHHHTHPHQHVHDLQQHPSMTHQLHQPSGVMRQKRLRTSFKHHQLRIMKTYFALNHNPDAKDLKQLAQKTGLGKRILQVWFQNARAKYRRSVARQEIEARSGSGSGTSTGGLHQSDAAVEVDSRVGQHHCNQSKVSDDECGTQQGHVVPASANSSRAALASYGSYHADCVDLDRTTTSNSVDSSMSEFLNSSLSDEVM